VPALKSRQLETRHLGTGHVPDKMSAFRLEQAVKRFGGWDAVVSALVWTNPFSDECLNGTGAPIAPAPAIATTTPGATPTPPPAVAALLVPPRAKRPSGKKYFFIVSDAGVVLGLYNDMNQPGVALVAGPPRLSPFQQWKLDGLGCFKNRATGLVVDINQQAQAGQTLVQWPAHGGSSQRWNIFADGTIRMWDNPNLCMDVDFGTPATPQHQSRDKPVILWWFRDTTPRKPNQVWHICNFIPLAPPASSPSPTHTTH